MSQKTNSRAMLEKVCNILITGPPGVGKTTLVKKICEKLNSENLNIKYQGFYTEEVRENQTSEGGGGRGRGGGRRLGFDIVALNNGQRRGVLARETSTGASRAPMVGKYAVNLNEFEAIALEALKFDKNERKFDLLIIDEIGKMELKSRNFKLALDKVKNQVPLLATVPLKTASPDLKIVEELKQAKNSKLYTLSGENRNDLIEEIIADIKEFCGK